MVQGCVFERLDGNAVIVSGYNRNAVIDSCEFAWIGDTCIAEWGRTRGTPVDGPDGGQEVYHLHMHVMGGPRPWAKG